MTKPCLTCGAPSSESYCSEHRSASWQHPVGSARDRGYSAAWDRLSRRARRLQPFCSDCGDTQDLQLDHTEHTWARIEAGKVVRLSDTGGVVCGRCNRRRGAARGRGGDQGDGPIGAAKGPGGKPQTPSLSTSRYMEELC